MSYSADFDWADAAGHSVAYRVEVAEAPAGSGQWGGTIANRTPPSFHVVSGLTWDAKRYELIPSSGVTKLSRAEAWDICFAATNALRAVLGQPSLPRRP